MRRIAAMCGSFRKGSFNQSLLNEAIERAPKHDLEIVQVEIKNFPFYSQDLQTAEGDPEAVRLAKRTVAESKCVLLATPEYDYGVPGVLKNAVEWLSRPVGDPTLLHKPMALMGASTGYMGTIRAQLAWRQVWVFLKGPVFSEIEMTVSFAKKAFNQEGKLVDEMYRQRLEDYLEALSKWLDG